MDPVLALSVRGGSARWSDLSRDVARGTRCLPLVEAVVLLDGLLRDGVLDAADLEAVAADLPSRFPHRRAFALVDPRAESVLESAVRVGCVLAGLDVASQVRLAGVGRADLLVEGWLVVETDGREHHGGAFAEDRRRAEAADVCKGVAHPTRG
ncbi:hypothetical protein GTR02_05680 [Kineococcus sp. R8]|uniref:GxxExxY protein n=1 Tax=Kineococcus siccus TaxID=2696567 RepID=UPI001412259C|nr:GxxExxY protein [Kineococcus siccus]NAZ81301.1 hypothetical protein [Kineococcus siccus]